MDIRIGVILASDGGGCEGRGGAGWSDVFLVCGGLGARTRGTFNLA